MSDLDLDRDITLSEAAPSEFSATDTVPLSEAPHRVLYALLSGGGIVERRRAALALAERPPDDRTIGALERAVRGDDHDIVRMTARRALEDGTSVAGLDEGGSVGDDPLNETPDL